MELNVGDRVSAESESTERPARLGVIEEVIAEGRFRIRWDDGHESIYTPAAGALGRAPEKSAERPSARTGTS
jgi:hypothetical protein